MFSQKSTAPNKTPKFFLTFAMKNFDKSKGGPLDACPLDNNRISNGYIKAEGKMSYSLDNSDDRKYKCFTLHPVIENKDITPYKYGDIGYDLNADSMKIYAGGWNDLSANNNGNKIMANINTLDTDGKKGHLYLDKNGQVHIKMLNKVIQRAKLLKQYANNYNPFNNNSSIFENNSCDTSFTSDNYDIEVDKSASSNQQNNNTNNHFMIKQKELNGQSKNEVRNFHNDYGLSPYECFELTYNKDNNEFTLHSNELDGVALEPKKGIKVDRIFVNKSVLDINSDYWLEIYKNIKKRETKCQQYIQNIIEVLIKNFPNGDIRIIDGQNFEIIKTEDFIKTYVQDEDEKNFYLSELEKKRESMQQHKEEQIITSKDLKDISLHTSHNNEIDNQQKRESTQNKEEQIITSKDLKDISLHTSHNNEIDNQQKRESTQNKEEQIITSKYQEDTSLHTSRNKENISMPQQEQAMDNQRKNYNNHQSKSFSHTQPAKDTASNLIKKHSEVLNQPNIGNNNIIPNSTNTNENNKNNNNSGLHLCSRWKQCWERCW